MMKLLIEPALPDENKKKSDLSLLVRTWPTKWWKKIWFIGAIHLKNMKDEMDDIEVKEQVRRIYKILLIIY